MTTETVFPEWATVGAKVLIVNPVRWYAGTYEEAEIVRLTPTRIVVRTPYGADVHYVRDRKYRENWIEYGLARSNKYLVGADTPDARELYRQREVARLTSEAITASEAFTKQRTEENARTAIEALTQYLERPMP